MLGRGAAISGCAQLHRFLQMRLHLFQSAFGDAQVTAGVALNALLILCNDCRQHHQKDVLVAWSLAQNATELFSVNQGHDEIGDDHLGIKGGEYLQGLKPGSGTLHQTTLALEHGGNCLEQHRVIVDHQDSYRHGLSSSVSHPLFFCRMNRPGLDGLDQGRHIEGFGKNLPGTQVLGHLQI